MKVKADALGNLAYKAIFSNDGEIGTAGYHRPVDQGQVLACDEVIFAAQITQALAERKKRIIIEVAYPTPSHGREGAE